MARHAGHNLRCLGHVAHRERKVLSQPAVSCLGHVAHVTASVKFCHGWHRSTKASSCDAKTQQLIHIVLDMLSLLYYDIYGNLNIYLNTI